MHPETVHFSKEGKLYVEKFNDNLKIKELEFVPKEIFHRFYDDEVVFDPDLTVEGFMNCLLPYFSIIDEHFYAYTRGYELEEYYNHMQNERTEDKKSEVDYVELHWSSELSEYDDLVEGKIESSFDLYGSFHGKGTDKVTGDKINFGLGLSPMNQWKHLPIKLNTEIVCTTIKHDPIRMDVVFKSEKSWVLHDVIKAFFFELTWYGYPEDAKDFSDQLEKTQKGIEEGIIETVAFDIDEFKIETYEEMKKEELEKQNFEGVIRIDKEIKKLKDKKDNEQKN